MPIPFSSKDYNKINLVNIADSSTIINNTITSNDIADNSIINNNFANGSITSDKLSTALQNIFVDFDDRLTALETPPSGWSGTITFNRTGGGGDPYISLRTDTQVITTDYDYNNESDTFSVSLTTPQSYVEIAFTLYGNWGMYSHSFSSYFGNPYIYYDQATGREWYRYIIMPNIQSNLTYNFSTFYDD